MIRLVLSSKSTTQKPYHWVSENFDFTWFVISPTWYFYLYLVDLQIEELNIICSLLYAWKIKIGNLAFILCNSLFSSYHSTSLYDICFWFIRVGTIPWIPWILIYIVSSQTSKVFKIIFVEIYFILPSVSVFFTFLYPFLCDILLFRQRSI